MATGCPGGCHGCGFGRLADASQASGQALAGPALRCFGLPLAVLLAGAWLAHAIVPGHAWLALAGLAGAAGLNVLAGCRGKPSRPCPNHREDA